MLVFEIALLDGSAVVKSGYLRKVIHAIQWRLLTIVKTAPAKPRQKKNRRSRIIANADSGIVEHPGMGMRCSVTRIRLPLKISPQASEVCEDFGSLRPCFHQM